MTKKTVYTLFTLKFLFSLALIFWTIKITMTAGVGSDHDNTFFSNYKDMDTGYNDIINGNIVFNNKYETQIKINETLISELSYKDVYLSQRIMQKRKKNINVLKLKDNNISIIVKNKSSKQIIDNINVKITLTRPSTHDDNLDLELEKSGINKTFNINKKAYWNIMGVIKIGEDEGHFFIKTNSK